LLRKCNTIQCAAHIAPSTTGIKKMATRNRLSGRWKCKKKGDRRERKNLEEMGDLGHHLLLLCIGCCQKDGMNTPPMMHRPESSEAAAATAYCAKD
jgi:hypothetical protein